MYLDFFGFREPPFELTTNPKYLFLTTKHREVLSNLWYGISAQKGVTVLVGEAGTGKTTLVRAALDLHNVSDGMCVCLNNPTLTRQEFYEFLVHGFQLPSECNVSKTRFLFELHERLIERHRNRALTALIVDEAQSLSLELLEEIRLLANTETDTHKLLPVILAGQPELADRLNQPQLRQLKQRISLRCELQALDTEESAAYIAWRIKVAGGDPAAAFTRDAIALIFARSKGIPRTISVICDNALVNGFALDCRPVTRELVMEVCRDFDLGNDGEARDETPDHSVAGHNGGPPSQSVDVPKHQEGKPLSRLLFRSFGERRRFSFF